MNMMTENAHLAQRGVAVVKEASVREMTFERAGALMMLRVLGEVENFPLMDKGDRRKKKIEKEKGKRPEKGKGSKASTKSQLDLVIFDTTLTGLQFYDGRHDIVTGDDNIFTANPMGVLEAISVEMKKKEEKKTKYKDKKNDGKSEQQEKQKKKG